MKRAIISVSAIVLILALAGCSVNRTRSEQDTDSAESKAPEIIPFGLTLEWKVKPVPGDEAWQDVSWKDIHHPRHGILVKEVLDGRQALERGFEPGDIIYAVNDKRFKNTSQFIRILYGLSPGKAISFYIIRGQGDENTLDVKFMVIPTHGYTDWNFPGIYGHHRNDYARRTHVFYFLFYDKRVFSSRTFGILPFYHRERIGKVNTHRIFWFFKWRSGVEEDVTI